MTNNSPRQWEELGQIWAEAGVDVSSYEFDPPNDLPRNSVYSAADPEKKALVYAKILELSGEESPQ